MGVDVSSSQPSSQIVGIVDACLKYECIIRSLPLGFFLIFRKSEINRVDN